jgi:iron(III) transport system substrate-binding protein
MTKGRITRRDALLGSTALAGATLSSGFKHSAVAQGSAPAPTSITPALIEAATKEGKIVWYTAVDVNVAEKVSKGFEAKFPGIAVKVERTGGERIFQRVGQETSSKIYAVDVLHSSDAAHFIVWKREGLLAPVVPEDVAKHYPAEHKDADGMYASWRIFLSVIAYNTSLVKPEDAPKSYADLLDPKWVGKMVKSHPGYSGSTMTATHQLSRDLGWEYLEKLSKQKIMQVQSASDPPKKLALGERAVQADGVDYLIYLMKDKGQPVEVVYATEGTPLIVGPSGVAKNAPNPNAARLFHAWSFTAEAQQLNIDVGGLYSAHALVKDRPGRRALKDIKLLKDDPAAVEKLADEIKEKYAKYFKV